jgi:hypothetical protein
MNHFRAAIFCSNILVMMLQGSQLHQQALRWRQTCFENAHGSRTPPATTCNRQRQPSRRHNLMKIDKTNDTMTQFHLKHATVLSQRERHCKWKLQKADTSNGMSPFSNLWYFAIVWRIHMAPDQVEAKSQVISSSVPLPSRTRSEPPKWATEDQMEWMELHIHKWREERRENWTV